jgi:membrane associated rhomboid family serine protease
VSADEAGPQERLPLRRDATPIAFEEDGFHHPVTSRGRGHARTRYADLTHVAATPRALWIGSRRSVYPLPRTLFVEPAGPERLARALLERVARLPDGAGRIARMNELDRMAREPQPALATHALAAACALVFALQLGVGLALYEVGHCSRALVADGDLWRLVTAGLLHGFLLHLAVNLVGLAFFGRMVERALGTPRVVCILGASQVVSMAAASFAHSGGVVGISGVVAGLVGALLYMELRLREDLPAWWRLPRWLFGLLVFLILLQALVDRAIPIIAAEAHLGGFAAGFTTAAFLMRTHRVHEAAGPRLRAAAGGVALVALLAVLAAVGSLVVADDYRAEHATRIAGLPAIEPEDLNNHAWMIAIDPGSTEAQLEAALRLAERAVRETDRADPTFLDTLAEVQFQLGRADLAVATIDEAIEHAPGESYYREQRRRFVGERDPDDRPPDPALPWGGPERLPLPTDADGVTV